MIRIEFIQEGGETSFVSASPGDTLMATAKANGIDGVVAECGGHCSCATCHVHIDAPWFERLPPKKWEETELLTVAVGVDEQSRLSCQVVLGPEHDGLQVRVPATQS